MTDKNIIKEVEKWKELLSLHDWIFIVQPIKNSTVSDCGELAQCYICEESMSVNIVIAIDLPEEEIKKSIKHEMLHVALNDLSSVFNDAMGLIGVEGKTALGGRYHKCEEKLVIKIERLIDKIMAQNNNSLKDN